MEHQSFPTPHVLILPLPVQGHVTPMLNLAQLLCIAKFKVTFINTARNQKHLSQYTNIESRFNCYPGFKFRTIPDPVLNKISPSDSSKSKLKDMIKALIAGLKPSAEPILRELLLGPKETDKVTCFILDGWMNFGHDIANEAEVPVFTFRCSSGCANWAYFCIPHLIQAGDVPFQGMLIFMQTLLLPLVDPLCCDICDPKQLFIILDLFFLSVLSTRFNFYLVSPGNQT